MVAANRYVDPDGRVRCRECNRETKRALRRRQRRVDPVLPPELGVAVVVRHLFDRIERPPRVYGSAEAMAQWRREHPDWV